MKHAPGQLIWHTVCSKPLSFQKGLKKLSMDLVIPNHLTSAVQSAEGLGLTHMQMVREGCA